MTHDRTSVQTPRNDIWIHVDILGMCTRVRALSNKMKYSQKRNERIINVLNSRLENPKNETLQNIARNLTLDLSFFFTLLFITIFFPIFCILLLYFFL
jgi:hypothetical protein